ncbi:hypothetical protein B0T20DRAFT_236839 [Sordaria brevicollis]|uniref:Uncharacterized protein n=1 Tax=Sordaria brevicollis TaxID=83679 RepID=A0AAE0PDR0_SORBR|nr:hypothetical protein B0T20DRAFT_236839 [Sordaria brevicollis]
MPTATCIFSILNAMTSGLVINRRRLTRQAPWYAKLRRDQLLLISNKQSHANTCTAFLYDTGMIRIIVLFRLFFQLPFSAIVLSLLGHSQPSLSPIHRTAPSWGIDIVWGIILICVTFP